MGKLKDIKFGRIGVLCFIGLLVVFFIYRNRLEGKQPEVHLNVNPAIISATNEIPVDVSDVKSGIKSIRAELIQGERNVVLDEKAYPSDGFLNGGNVHNVSFVIPVKPEELGFTEGKAVIRIIADDHSLRRWMKGNRTLFEKEVLIDMGPPVIEVLHHVNTIINQGGTALVVYRLSEACRSNGVVVGDNFFPGHSGLSKNDNIKMAFFALRYDQGRGTDIFIKAVDMAGNSAVKEFNHKILGRHFKKDTINISDGFLSRKMPEFDDLVSYDPGSMTRLNQFLKVNSELRKANGNKMIELSEKTDEILYWDGAFLRLPNSKRMAGFADHRTYIYKKDVIDRQVHMGVDLASIAGSPVPASIKVRLFM